MRVFEALFILVGVVATTAVSSARCEDEQLAEIYARPPELVGGPWLNTAKNEPIRLADRKGKVTIIHFWTFG